MTALEDPKSPERLVGQARRGGLERQRRIEDRLHGTEGAVFLRGAGAGGKLRMGRAKMHAVL